MFDIRDGWISIEGRDGLMHDYRGLDFKFAGEKVGSVFGKFECAICGLCFDTINEISAWNVADTIRQKRLVEVYAGYEKTTPNKIFSGYLFEASPTPPPGMWVNMICLPKLDGAENASVDMEGTVTEIGRSVASMLDLDFRLDTKVEVEGKVRFSYSGNKEGLADSLAKCFGTKTFVEDGVLVMTSKRGWLEQIKKSRTISMETGMIGIPKVDMRGATIRVRLDDSFDICSWIYLDSKTFPKANGYYFVIRKKHVGHIRGDDWYTDIETIRAGASV